MRSLMRSLHGRVALALDVLLAVWVAAWIALGVAVGVQVHGLRQLSTTTGRVGHAVQSSGRTLSSLGGVPLVGGRIGSAGKQIERAGASAVRSAQISRGSVSRLSWMLAVAIALIPSTPVLGLYVPARLLAMRERRSLLALCRARQGDPALDRLLAQRALAALPYGRLHESAGGDPWEAYESGRYAPLAQAELDRWSIPRDARRRRRPRRV